MRTGGAWPRSVGGRLFLSYLTICVAMAASIVLVGVVVGPPTFHEHMIRAGIGNRPEILAHAEEAFASAGLVSLGAGLGVALIGALTVSLYTARRIAGTLHRLSEAARTVAAGAYEEHIPLPRAGSELDRLTASFNAMAESLAATEATRLRMLTDVAHEMKTPLAALQVLAEGLEDGVVSPSPDIYAAIHHQVTRLDRLATDIRNVSAAAEGRLSMRWARVELAEVARLAQARFEPEFAAKGVRLLTAVDSGVAVRGDAARLDQILNNLLSNALHHTPRGGTVTMSLERQASAAVLTITDTGEGIAAGDLPHVFERFFRADPARSARADSGTGVGLTISQSIALAHDGLITADSAGPGEGATFRLQIPAL